MTTFFFHHVDMCVNEDFWLQRVLTVCSYNYSTETYKLIQLRLQQCKNNNIHFSENNLVSFELWTFKTFKIQDKRFIFQKFQSVPSYISYRWDGVWSTVYSVLFKSQAPLSKEQYTFYTSRHKITIKFR